MDARELYTTLIIDHSRHPRHFEVLATPSCSADGHNPLCGDHISMAVQLNATTIENIGFQGAGCAICMASASLMADHLIGKSISDATTLFHTFHQEVTDKNITTSQLPIKLSVLLGVKEFPSRVKCATLAWHTLHAALTQPTHATAVSTEHIDE